jgi:hypothetical protein
MEVLQELEQKLNIQPLNFNRWKGEITSPPDAEVEEVPYGCVVHESYEDFEKQEEPIVQETSSKERHFTRSMLIDVANHWGVDVDKVENLYEQAEYYYKTSQDEETVRLCDSILDGLYYNNLTRQEVNKLIRELMPR